VASCLRVSSHFRRLSSHTKTRRDEGISITTLVLFRIAQASAALSPMVFLATTGGKPRNAQCTEYTGGSEADDSSLRPSRPLCLRGFVPSCEFTFQAGLISHEGTKTRRNFDHNVRAVFPSAPLPASAVSHLKASCEFPFQAGLISHEAQSSLTRANNFTSSGSNRSGVAFCRKGFAF